MAPAGPWAARLLAACLVLAVDGFVPAALPAVSRAAVLRLPPSRCAARGGRAPRCCEPPESSAEAAAAAAARQILEASGPPPDESALLNMRADPNAHFRPASSAESAASFQVAARNAAATETSCPRCSAAVMSDTAFCPSCSEPILLGGPIVRHWTTAQAEEMQHTNSQLGDSSCAPAATLTALKMIQALPTDATERLVLTDGLMRLVRQRACKCRHTAMDADSDCDVSLQTFLLARGACGGGGSAAMIDLVESKCPDVVGGAVNIGQVSPFGAGEMLEWMARWISDGAALTITMNRQKLWDITRKMAGNTKRMGAMPDAWHAQPVVGVDLTRREVICANPVKVIPEALLEAALPSASTLRLRGNEVLLHASRETEAGIQAMNWPSESWREQGVSQQVLLLRKHFPGDLWLQANKAYVTIPYSGTGDGVGPVIRLFAKRESRAGQRILSARDGTQYTMSAHD